MDFKNQDFVEKPVFILLKHRTAAEVKQVVEQILGISSSDSGGGGGNPLSGLIGGAARNMMGGAAGDLVGGMLGGGGSSASTSSTQTSGDVTINLDPKLNAMIVTADPVDMQRIKSIVDFIDRESPPHDPQLNGMTKPIPVVYQNAEDIVSYIKELWPDRIKSAQSGQQQQRADRSDHRHP